MNQSIRLPRAFRRDRGAAAVSMILTLIALSLLMIGLVLGGARDQDLTLQRMSTLRSFYAAEAGVNMGIREIMMNSDLDGDGVIGSISNDGNAANDPVIGGGRVVVTRATNNDQVTLVASGTAVEARRKAQAILTISNTGTFGNLEPPPSWSMWNTKDHQVATPVVMSDTGTVTSLTGMIWGASAQYMRMALYTDGGGKPGALLAQTPTAPIQNNHGGWRTLELPPTLITPGTYWLALCTNTNSVSYYFASPGVVHIRQNAATSSGFLPNWGTSDSTRNEKLAIYGTYSPDGNSAAKSVLGWQEIE